MSNVQITKQGGTVRLEWSEVWKACSVGCKRCVESIKNNLPNHAYKRDDDWSLDIEGAFGELALAKFLGVTWSEDVNTFKSKPDVENFEVRTTTYPTGSLIVRHRDSDDSVFVLVTSATPVYQIRGWISGKEAKQEKWLKNPGGRGAQYFVPQSNLHPMSDFRKTV